jgi:hypothetical protein
MFVMYRWSVVVAGWAKARNAVPPTNLVRAGVGFAALSPSYGVAISRHV